MVSSSYNWITNTTYSLVIYTTIKITDEFRNVSVTEVGVTGWGGWLGVLGVVDTRLV